MHPAVLYEDENILAVDKPASIAVFPEGKVREKTVIDILLEKFPSLSSVGKPPRYGIVHRLDKETSGVLLVAKNNRVLEFLQEQFQQAQVQKKYIALVVGRVKNEYGVVESLLGRSPKDRRKQKVYLPAEPQGGVTLRQALSEYRVLQRFKNFTLLEVIPRTGRKHQIRAQFAHLGHPLAGDKLYGFKNQPVPPGLKRQFLHAASLTVTLPSGERKTISSPLPKDLKMVLLKLEETIDANES